MQVFGIPDDLPNCGIVGIRTMIFRKRDGHVAKVFEITHGTVDVMGGDSELDASVTWAFSELHLEHMARLEREHYQGEVLLSREARGDVVIVEYRWVESGENAAKNMVEKLRHMLSNIANRHP
jgi:isocitrate dehydrogenase